MIFTEKERNSNILKIKLIGKNIIFTKYVFSKNNEF